MNADLLLELVAKSALDFGQAQGSAPGHDKNPSVDTLVRNCESKKRSLAQRGKHPDANQEDFHPTDMKIDAGSSRLRIPVKLEET